VDHLANIARLLMALTALGQRFLSLSVSTLGSQRVSRIRTGTGLFGSVFHGRDAQLNVMLQFNNPFVFFPINNDLTYAYF
jgi:hypothetical protein